MNVMTLGNMKAKIEFGQDTELFRGEILGLTGSVASQSSPIGEVRSPYPVRLLPCP